jgi:hypothetical protein
MIQQLAKGHATGIGQSGEPGLGSEQRLQRCIQIEYPARVQIHGEGGYVGLAYAAGEKPRSGLDRSLIASGVAEGKLDDRGIRTAHGRRKTWKMGCRARAFETAAGGALAWQHLCCVHHRCTRKQQSGNLPSPHASAPHVV